MRLKRSARLSHKKDFQQVFAGRNKVRGKYLLVLYRKTNSENARLGIVLAKQHLKLAILRNQIRRIIRESFRHQQKELKGLDLVVLMRSECTTLDKKAVREDIDQLWQTLITALKKS